MIHSKKYSEAFLRISNGKTNFSFLTASLNLWHLLNSESCKSLRGGRIYYIPPKFNQDFLQQHLVQFSFYNFVQKTLRNCFSSLWNKFIFKFRCEFNIAETQLLDPERFKDKGTFFIIVYIWEIVVLYFTNFEGGGKLD